MKKRFKLGDIVHDRWSFYDEEYIITSIEKEYYKVTCINAENNVKQIYDGDEVNLYSRYEVIGNVFEKNK